MAIRICKSVKETTKLYIDQESLLSTHVVSVEGSKNYV